jgi:acetyl esterase/lipase
MQRGSCFFGAPGRWSIRGTILAAAEPVPVSGHGEPAIADGDRRDTTSRIRCCRRSTATFTGFPPAILTSGTRDLFLSLTVLTHRKVRGAGIEAELQVYEGLSHARYNFAPYAPETKEIFGEIALFFDKHLAK